MCPAATCTGQQALSILCNIWPACDYRVTPLWPSTAGQPPTLACRGYSHPKVCHRIGHVQPLVFTVEVSTGTSRVPWNYADHGLPQHLHPVSPMQHRHMAGLQVGWPPRGLGRRLLSGCSLAVALRRVGIWAVFCARQGSRRGGGLQLACGGCSAARWMLRRGCGRLQLRPTPELPGTIPGPGPNTESERNRPCPFCYMYLILYRLAACAWPWP